MRHSCISFVNQRHVITQTYKTIKNSMLKVVEFYIDFNQYTTQVPTMLTLTLLLSY